MCVCVGGAFSVRERGHCSGHLVALAHRETRGCRSVTWGPTPPGSNEAPLGGGSPPHPGAQRCQLGVRPGAWGPPPPRGSCAGFQGPGCPRLPRPDLASSPRGTQCPSRRGRPAPGRPLPPSGAEEPQAPRGAAAGRRVTTPRPRLPPQRPRRRGAARGPAGMPSRPAVPGGLTLLVGTERRRLKMVRMSCLLGSPMVTREPRPTGKGRAGSQSGCRLPETDAGLGAGLRVTTGPRPSRPRPQPDAGVVLLLGPRSEPLGPRPAPFLPPRLTWKLYARAQKPRAPSPSSG